MPSSLRALPGGIPDLWDRHGYPRLPIPAAIQGDVVHGALEIIVRALVKAGCSSTRSAEAVAVLRELAGYTKVAEDVLAKQLARFDGNPASAATGAINSLASSRIGCQAREQIQTYLNRMELRPSVVIGPGTPRATRHCKSYPARAGDHPEKELVAEHCV